jgi:hypothetical protein
MLTGPFDIPGLTGRGELGNISLVPKRVSGSDRSVFAERVSDDAQNAVARLALRFGQRSMIIERRLANLSLSRLELDGDEIDTDEVASFQPTIEMIVGVSFGDWIFCCDTCCFSSRIAVR